MIITTNIEALKTSNRLYKNDSNHSKAMGKLSSGLRINQAADDSAGLAISEKMRAQIRGLHQAERNAQDGISMIQTAEGGLAQIQDPALQRLRELAIQASNDTYTDADRQEIQKEVEQIKKGIDHIANNTQFNTISLLNQPKMRDLPDIIETSSEIATTTEIITESFPPDIESAKVLTSNSLLAVATHLDTVVAVGRGGGISLFNGTEWNNVNSGTGEVLADVTYGNGRFVVVGDDGNILTSTDGQAWTRQISSIDNPSNYNIHKVQFNGSEFLALATDYLGSNKILTSSDGLTWGHKDDSLALRDVSWGNGTYLGIGNDGTYTSADGENWTKTSDSSILTAQNIEFIGDKYIAVGKNSEAMISEDGINWTDVTITNDHGVTLTGIAYDGNQFVVVGDKSDDGTNRAKAYTSLDGQHWMELNLDSGHLVQDVTTTENGDFIMVGFNRIDIGSPVDPTQTPEPLPSASVVTTAASESSTVGAVTTNVTITTVDSIETTVTHSPTSITKEQTITKQTIKDTTIITSDIKEVNEESIRSIQVGANAGNGFVFQLSDVRTSSLGIKEIDLSTREGAEHAIEFIDGALKKVSSERSELGAYQNRLEHTIAHLSQTAVNLQAAESRIRDVEMAKEVMEMTKSNILSQASQSMLAQANKKPQSILQLLG